MSDWKEIRPIRIGGLVAVGFLDEARIVVGSHSGLGVFEATSGTRLDRVEDLDGEYSWFQESPAAARYRDNAGEHVVPVAGLRGGGTLRDATDDGWGCRKTSTGAVLSGPAGDEITIYDDDDSRALGFSAMGQVFLFATSSTLYVTARSTS